MTGVTYLDHNLLEIQYQSFLSLLSYEDIFTPRYQHSGYALEDFIANSIRLNIFENPDDSSASLPIIYNVMTTSITTNWTLGLRGMSEDVNINKPNGYADEAVAQREVDFVVADGFSVVLAEEAIVLGLLPDGADGLAQVAEHIE